MISCSVPKGVRKVADCYKDLCEGRLASFNNQCALICLFLFGFDTLSATARACPWSHSVSDLSRAVDGLRGNRFMRRLRSRILRRYRGELNAQDFCLVVDDTANPRYGRSLFRCGSWHSSSGPYYGQKLVVLALVDIKSDFALPLAYRLATKKLDPAYIPTLKLSIDMLSEAKDAGFGDLPVVCDSWYDSADFIRDVMELGMTFAGEIKASRWVRANPGQRVPWVKPHELFLKLVRTKTTTRCDRREIKNGKKRPKSIATSVVHIRGLRKTLRGIAVYNRHNGTRAFAYYIATDLLMTGAKLWELSRARWRIERMFRDLKQNLSFGRLPCSGEAGIDVAVAIPFILLVSLRLDPPQSWGLEKADVIGTMVGQISECALSKAIRHIVEKPDSDVVGRLKGRRHLTKINKKPVNRVAESYRIPKKPAA